MQNNNINNHNTIMLTNSTLQFKKGSLILLSGVPASGKSTFIEKHFKSKGLTDYVISSDELRDRYFGVLNGFDEDGVLTKTNNQDSSSLVFKMMEEIATYRCKNSLTTVIDAMNLHDEMRSVFVKLGNWSEVYTILFDEKVAIEYNNNRKLKGGHYVPQGVIETLLNVYQKDTKITNNQLVNASEIEDLKEEFNTLSIPKDSPIIILGDSHGISNFIETVENLETRYTNSTTGKKPFFICTGDLVDRGPMSVENLIYVFEKAKEGNWKFLMGNHEQRLLNNINDYLELGTVTDTATIARYKTIRDLIDFCGKPYEGDISIMKGKSYKIQQVKHFLKTFEDYLILEDSGVSKFFLSHAPFLPADNLGLIRSSEAIFGMDLFKSKNAHKLPKNAPVNFIKALQSYSVKNNNLKFIFGHLDFTQEIEISKKEMGIKDKDFNVYSIDGLVYEDGEFNSLILTTNSKGEVDIVNEKVKTGLKYKSYNMVTKLKRQFDSLIEKKIITVKHDHRKYGENLNIYKYSRKVFYDHLWGTLTEDENEVLELARGIVLDPLGNIISFPFEKVFNYGEKTGLGDSIIEHKLHDGEYEFIEKLNGFLGVISPNPFDSGDLIIHTQGSLSTAEDHVFNRYIVDLLSSEQKSNILKFFREQGKHTLIFEVIHKEDPHIVKYEDSDYGLKLIGCRNIEGKDWRKMKLFSEDELDVLAKTLKFVRPNHFKANLSEILELCKTTKNIEGFMVRDKDSGKHLVKIKSAYYLTTKFLSRMNEGNYKYLCVNKDKFIQDRGIEEEFFPIIDFIYDNQKEFLTYSKEDKLKVLQNFILNELSST